jgi:hypothetical protein
MAGRIAGKEFGRLELSGGWTPAMQQLGNSTTFALLLKRLRNGHLVTLVPNTRLQSLPLLCVQPGDRYLA